MAAKSSVPRHVGPLSTECQRCKRRIQQPRDLALQCDSAHGGEVSELWCARKYKRRWRGVYEWFDVNRHGNNRKWCEMAYEKLHAARKCERPTE